MNAYTRIGRGERARDLMLLETCASCITEFLELCFPASESSGRLTNWPVILCAGHLLLLNTHSLATDTRVLPALSRHAARSIFYMPLYAFR